MRPLGKVLFESALAGVAVAGVGLLVLPYYIEGDRPAAYGPIPAVLKNRHFGLFATGFFTHVALEYTTANRRLCEAR